MVQVDLSISGLEHEWWRLGGEAAAGKRRLLTWRWVVSKSAGVGGDVTYGVRY